MSPQSVRSLVLRVAALALLLLLVLVAVLSVRTLNRVPDSLVYFVRETGNSFTLEGVGRKLEQSGREAHLRAVVEALVRGPTAAERARGLSTTLPEGTRVLELRLAGSRLVLDLSGNVEAGGGTALMSGRLNQLYYSLTQPSYVESVELRVEGVPLVTFGGEGLMLEQPWQRSRHPELPRW